MNDVEMVILSLVAEAPRTGDEFQQAIEQRGLREWTAVGTSSVSYVLQKLERERLIASESVYPEKRTVDRRYQITDSGRAVLRTAVIDLITRGDQGLGRFELGLLMAGSLDARRVREALYQRRDELRRQLERAQAALKEFEPLSIGFDVRGALYERRAALIEADLNWLQVFEQAWAEHTGSLPASPSPEPPPSQSKETPIISRDDSLPEVKRLQKLRRPPDDEPES